MQLVVTTIVRDAPMDLHGFVYLVDWDKKKVLHRFQPPPPRAEFDIPRGGNRGFRGITFIGDNCYIANHDSVFGYDEDWNLVETIAHPYFASILEIEAERDQIWVVSTGVDGIFKVERDGNIVEEHFVGEYPIEYRSQLGIRERKVDRSVDHRETEPDTSSNVAHPNGINLVDDRPYVTLYRPGALIGLNPFEVIWRDDSSYGSHSGRLLKNKSQICIAASFKSEFLGIDLKTDENAFRVSVLEDPGKGFSLKGMVQQIAHMPVFSRLPTTFILKHAPAALRGFLPTSRPGWTRGIALIDNEHLLGGSSSATISMVNMREQTIVEQMQMEDGIEHSVFAIAIDPRGQ